MTSLTPRMTIHLSPAGNDAGSGRRGDPVATLAQAVRLARASEAARRRIVVGEGMYCDTSVTLEAPDSGLEIIAAPGLASGVFRWRAGGGLACRGR